MSIWPEHHLRATALLTLALGAAAAQASDQAQAAYPGIGRAATAREVAAWDIDVRPDFKGLPKGSGSVAEGQLVWESKCESCHGVFGEANNVFSPLVGGTTAEDIKTGRVARLDDPSFPGRTTLMKVSTLSTLWDYINRAMPWTAPKTLATNEVYAVTAYLLNLGGIIPDRYVLSDANMAATQRLLPNRNGMTTLHGLWPGRGLGLGGTPDVRAVACMKDCGPVPRLASFLPDYARNQHGNLADQQRLVGPQRGAQTGPTAQVASASQAANGTESEGLLLARQHGCTACHGLDSKIVGPSLREVAQRYAARGDAESYLAGKISTGGQGLWGAVPMPAQTLPENDARRIARWLAAGAQP